jgi:ankyrin repeat protein
MKSITPIFIAAHDGNYDIARMLLELGADPNICSSLSDNIWHTPLSLAREKGHMEVAELLQQYGARE